MQLIVIDTVNDTVYREDLEPLLFNCMEDENVLIEEYVNDEERPRSDNLSSILWHAWEIDCVWFDDLD